MAVRKLQYIDAIRGIAILMVILVHTAQKIEGLSSVINAVAQYGQMGVQLFFLASAYTLCRAFAQRRDEDKPLMAFFIRRFFRIAPLYYFGIIFYSAIYFLARELNLPLGMQLGPYTLKNVLANMFFVHGFVISANNNIVPGGWSIGTEMAFYSIFPVLFVCCTALRARGIGYVWFGFALICLISLSFAAVIGRFEQGVVYRDFFSNNIVSQMPVFFMGMVLFFLQNHDETVPLWLKSWTLQAIGFIFFTFIVFNLWDGNSNTQIAVRVICVGISFFCLFNLLRICPHPLAILCAIGRVSFSMYMFHFFFAKFLLGLVIANESLPVSPDTVLVASFVAVCVITFAVAIVTERTIENHGIRFGNAVIARVRSRVLSS